MGDYMDRAEFERIKQMENEILRGRPVGSVTNGGYGKQNGLTPEQTIGFINKQSANDAEWKAVKAFYNGSWNMLERGVLGSLAMLRDNNIESLKAQGIEVGDGGKYIDMALNSDHLQPYEVKGNTQLGQLGLDLAQGAGQLASQAALAVTTGGIGSTLAMGASIAGNQYADLRREGVPVDRATRASVMNAGIQAPLERLSIGNILSKLPAGSGLRQKVVQIAQNAITEGVTEYVQQYPEEIANIYAKNGGSLEEIANKTLERLPEIHRNGLYAAMIGVILGSGAGAINVAVRRNVNAAQLEAVEGRVEQAKQIGITPEAYANTVNNNLPDSNVSVDGDVLLKFMQSGKTEEIAQSLGVTVNEVQQAADEGLTVEIRQGNYEGTAMKYADFMPAVRDYSAFEVNGFMQSDTQGQKELQKEYQQFTDNEEEFQAYKDEKIAEMQAAGINKQEALNAMILLESRARVYNPDNPLAFFEAYPIEFRRGTDGGEFNQPEVLDNDTANLRSIQKALEKYNYVAVRGLTGVNAKKKYRKGQRLAPSIDDPDGRGIEFHPELPKLPGTSGIPVSQLMYDDELLKMIEAARQYGENGRIALIAGDSAVDGSDVRETVIKNAKFLGYLDEGKVLEMPGEKAEKKKKPHTMIFSKQDVADYRNMVLDRVVKQYPNLNRLFAWEEASFEERETYRNLGNYVSQENEKWLKDIDVNKVKKELEEYKSTNVYNQSAYHGTPHSFERFDLGAIGTGEGNQAHGWGLYFAADKKIADERYRKRLTNDQYIIETDEATYYFDIEKQDWVDKKTGQPVGGMSTPLGHAVWEIGFREGNVEAALKALKGQRDALIEENDSSNAQRLDFLIRTIKLLEEKKFNYRKDNGSLFEVDIPENDVLLDEDKPLNEQPLSVRKAILEYYKSRPDNYVTEGITIDDLDSQKGGQFYKDVVFQMQSEGAENPQKAASELLNEYGIKGITYDGARDGRCFVIFDDKAISIINRYNQSANEGNRGSIRWESDGAAIVELFSAADASTFIHESIGHYFANVLAKEAVLPGANEQTVKDFEIMLDYAGTTRERWEYLNSKPRPALTEQEDAELVKIQETWATAAEQYILEGKAPNRELQPVFNRFKKWLLNVYKTIESFVKNNQYAVPITDEVRQVFDRMLASEQQISEMEKLNGYYAKLPKAITDNLSDAYKTRLYDAMAKAHDKAVQLLTRKSLENFTAERKEQIAEYRADMRPKVAEQVDNEPLYRAINELLEDNKHYKTGKALAEHYYDMVARSKNIEAKPLTEQEEMEVMTFDMFAESYGFSSGDDLAKAILESPTRQQAIKQRLDDEVQKKFPDIYKERRLAEAATQEAFYNDDTGAVLGLEEQIIEDAAKRTLDQQRNAEQQRQLAQMKRQQAKVQAQGYLRSVPLREALRIQKYITAERRAAANAATALAKGDYETALDYKHKQLLNHAMVQESINMNRRYTQYGKFFNRQRKLNKESWNNEENFMQVGALFARMGLRLRGYDARLKQQSLKEWADAMQADYDNVAIPDWIYDESKTFARPLSDLTFDEYEDVVNTLKNIKAVVKAQTMMEGEAKAKTFAETKAEGMAVLEKKPTKYTPDVNEKGKASAFEKFKRQLRNSDNFFEMMDGWTYGWYSKFFGETVRKAADVEAELTMQYEDATRQAYKEWLPDKAARKAANAKVKYDELGTSATKHTLIYMALNLGNESNAAKLCSTAVNSTFREFFPQSQLWVEGDVIQTKKNLLEFLGKNLTAADWRYVQKKIDIANMFWTQMSELERRDKGFAPPKVEAYPEIITLADGQQIVYRGGYFPLIRRRDTGSHPASQDAIPATTGGRPGDSIRTLHTNTGHTKARDNSVYPIDLTGGGEYAVAMDTIHDIAFREPMNNFRKLMNDREFYNMLKSKLGIADMEALEEFLKKAAQPYGGSGFATLSERDTGKFMSWLRNKTVNAAIMLNFKTSLQNLGNPFLYGRVVDGFGIKDAIVAYANYKKNWQGRKTYIIMRDFVYSKSVFMRERGKLPDISLRDMKDEGTELNPLEKRTIKWGTQMLTITDNLSALPVWIQAYQKKINAKASEQEAIQFADTVIRRTLGSSRITDVAPIQRGGPLMKLLTTFQGFFNTQYNQWNREFNVVTRLYKDKKYGEVVDRVTAFAAAKFLVFNLINLALAFENPLGDDDDDGWPKIATELLHYPISLLGPVGGIANATLNNMLGIRDYGYNMTAIEGSLDKLFKAGKLVGDIADGDKEVEEAVEPVAGVATMAAGIPNQLNKLFFNAWDILYNDMDAEWRDLFYRRPSRDR